MNRILNHLAEAMRDEGDPDFASPIDGTAGGFHRGAGEGRIAEQGTHAELVARGGYYAELSRKQALEEELEAI